MQKPIRGALAALFMGGFAAVSALPSAALAQYSSNSESKFSAIVIDAATGEVMYGRRADSPRYPASITKVMTLYMTFEALQTGRIRLSDPITMSRHAASMQPTKLGVRAGGTITVEEAIQALAIQSANDVAVAVAEHLAGSESRFGAMMTLRAHQLGMVNTRFVNASGLPDPRQISTARDIAILSQAMMRDYPQYYSYLGQRQFNYAGRVMNNHNNLLRSMPGVDGLKTGFTNASGYNLAASAIQGDTRLIAVVLGGTSNPQRDNEVARLLNVGFEVAARRDSGEMFASTQSAFLPTQYARATRIEEVPAAAGVELAQGDIAEGGMLPIPNPGEASRPRGQHVVQVGAFRERGQAQTQLRDVGRRFASLFDGAVGEVRPPSGGFYRAQFLGLTGEAARAACATLRASRVSCMVIAP